MKIKVTKYSIDRNRRPKNDIRLNIGISIDVSAGKKLDTSVAIQLNPIAYLAGKAPDLSFDMLYLSAIVYAIDRAVDRGLYSIDGWSREFDVDIVLPHFGQFLALEENINTTLSFLTGDYWTCHFIGDENVNYPKYKECDFFEGITQVNLFSGGMDSLIGAIDYMTNHPEGKLFLASHYDSYMHGPKEDQNKLKKLFYNKYKKQFCELPAVMITPEQSNERSCRSRSMMFLSIALIVASYAKCDVVVPENGSVSLNYPLSPSRRSSCSTRTTHPVFLNQFREIIKALGITVGISNPYEKLTKGEMVQNCADKDYLIRIVAKSNSCGKRRMHQYNVTHCGHCMPCMYRKAAMIGENDDTTYGNSFITLFNKKGAKVAKDFFAMLEFLKKDLTKEQIKRELQIGGMGRFDDLDDYVDLVVRTRKELSAMIIEDNNSTILRYMNWRK